MGMKPLKILSIDDDPADAYILERFLKEIKLWEIDFLDVRSAEAGLSALANHPVDIIFLDYLLGRDNGLGFVKKVRENGDKRPILVLTGQGDERIAASITRAGASDYLVKSEISADLLRRSIHGAIREYKLEQEKGDLAERAKALERIEAVAQVVRGVCHHFNNIHQIISGNLTLVADSLQGREKKALSGIFRAMERATKLNNQLQTYSSAQQRLSPLPLDLRVCLAEFIEQKTADFPPNIQATLKTEDSLWPIYADWQGLKDSLSRLLENAKQAMLEGGRLEIGATNMTVKSDEDKPVVEMGNGDYVKLTVADTGKGMPPEVAEKAFELFFSTENPATRSGLGLSLVRGFVQQSHGFVRIQSCVGQGTNLDIFLPRRLL